MSASKTTLNDTNNTQLLAGKVAIVTGSSRGIGASIAFHLAQHGCNVVINYLSSSGPAEALAQKIRSLSNLQVDAIAIQANVCLRPEITRLFAAAHERFGHIDIVISNSGIEHFYPNDSLLEVSEQEIDQVFNVNVKAQFWVAQEAYKYLTQGGRLVLMSSISAHRAIPNHAIYASAKSAIEGMVRSLAWDFGSKGVTVNAIAPGGVKSDMYAHAAAKYIPSGDRMSKDQIDQLVGSWSPFKRPGFPDDVAGWVSLLVSDESKWMTGQTFSISGGAFMG